MKAWRRVRYLLQRGSRAEGLREEMEFHLNERIDALIAEGVPAGEARFRAKREFGNMMKLEEQSRSTWIGSRLTDFVQDIRHGFRTVKREPGFAAVAILSSALGIGACSTIFGIANFTLFQPLPVSQPDRLLAINAIKLKENRAGETMSYLELQDLRRDGKTLASVTGVFPVLPASISSGGDPKKYWGTLASANYFDVVRPGFALGRGFDLKDDRIGEAPVVVLSHHLWRNRFGGDPSIVGKTIVFNGRSAQVLGVTAQGFRGTELLFVSDFWIPMSMIGDLNFLKNDSQERLTSRAYNWLSLVARLENGVAVSDAITEVDAIGRRSSAFGNMRDRSFHAELAGQLNVGVRPIVTGFFFLLLAVTVLVLLIACANVANLLLARASSRQREIATRLALGAERGRLIRQLLTESTVLAFAGGLGGILIAYWGTSALGRFHLPLPIPLDLSAKLDWRALLFTAVLSVMTGLVFGLLPALRASRINIAGTMKKDAAQLAGLRRFGLRNILVVAQVAASLVLLIASGLFLRSLQSSSLIDSGMTSHSLLFMSIDPTLNQYSDLRARSLFLDLQSRLESLPGVESASITNVLPLSMVGNATRLKPEGMSSSIRADIYTVAPDFFKTMGILLRQGRDFERSVHSPEVLIVNETFAKQAFPNETALGRNLDFNGRKLEIVGIVANSKSRMLNEVQTNVVYIPILQSWATQQSLAGVTLAVKTRTAPAAFTEAVKKQIAAIDPALPISNIKTMETHLTDALFLPRLAALMFGLCGGMGLTIAAIGVYGVISFSVARRTKEIGIRMALGATRSEVVAMILRYGFGLAAVGCTIGLLIGMALSKTASSLLYGISSTDWLTFCIVPTFLLVIALLAAWIPARRAANLDPLTALRYE